VSRFGANRRDLKRLEALRTYSTGARLRRVFVVVGEEAGGERRRAEVNAIVDIKSERIGRAPECGPRRAAAGRARGSA